MAVFYNKQKGIHGSLTGTIISFPVEVNTEDPAQSVSRAKLPAGYMRCDGRVLTNEDYPMLAVVLGTGDTSKFKKHYPNWKQKYNTKKIIEELIEYQK